MELKSTLLALRKSVISKQMKLNKLHSLHLRQPIEKSIVSIELEIERLGGTRINHWFEKR